LSWEKVDKNERFSQFKGMGEVTQTGIIDIYLTKEFTRDEVYGLISQMRHSASSIPTYIAEGCGRCGQAELNHFFYIYKAMRSASEQKTNLSRHIT
jgi:four helix bundle protein